MIGVRGRVNHPATAWMGDCRAQELLVDSGAVTPLMIEKGRRAHVETEKGEGE